MAIKYGERSQIQLFPTSIEDYVATDDPVRAYDAMIDALNLEDLGFNMAEDQVGNSHYDPRAMLKLWVYGISYGWKSSRKLERALKHNVSFMWLTGGLQPNFKTISEFRRKNKKPLSGILKQVARVCIQLKLIDGNILFVDGTKIRANANISQTWDNARCEKKLSKIDQRIEQILNECEAVDLEEQAQPSYVKMEKELTEQEQLRKRVQAIYSDLQQSDQKAINIVDSDSRKMYSVQGSHSQYSVQAVTDDKHGLIVSGDATQSPNDMGLLSGQLKQAEAVTGKKAEVICADAGYADVKDLLEINDDTTVIVPSQRQALKNPPGPFDKQHFTYDESRNCYICPAGKELAYRSYNKSKKCARYRPLKTGTCKSCQHFGTCTTSKRGREINRFKYEKEREHFESVYLLETSKEIYSRRKEKAEHPFGHIKYNLRTPGFLLRGLEGVKAETSLLFSCFNIRRMITILGGVEKMIQALP